MKIIATTAQARDMLAASSKCDPHVIVGQARVYLLSWLMSQDEVGFSFVREGEPQLLRVVWGESGRMHVKFPRTYLSTYERAEKGARYGAVLRAYAQDL